MQPVDHIRAIAARVAAERGLEIWDIQSRRESVGHVVRVFIDRPGPAATAQDSVSIEDCAEVNRELSTILDVEDLLPFAYVLEVSSPGLDRPLRCRADYVRFSGRWAKVVVSQAIDNQTAFEGRLRGVEQDGVEQDRVEQDGAEPGGAEPGGASEASGAERDVVVLETQPGRVHRLPMRLISRGRLDVEF